MSPFLQELTKDESDTTQKLAALQTKTDLEDEALLEATVRQGPGKYVSRYIPRTIAAPTFMDRKLQQLKVSSTDSHVSFAPLPYLHIYTIPITNDCFHKSEFGGTGHCHVESWG